MKQILIVDDNADLRDLYQFILNSEGYDTLTARSSIEALELIDLAKPDLILLDVQMEETTGPEFMSQLEALDPELFASLNIVLLTASEIIPVTKAKGYIRKMSDIDTVISAVRGFIN